MLFVFFLKSKHFKDDLYVISQTIFDSHLEPSHDEFSERIAAATEISQCFISFVHVIKIIMSLFSNSRRSFG